MTRPTHPLKPAKPGASAGLLHLYGRKPVIEALRLGLVRSLEISGRAHGQVVNQILRLAEEGHIPVTRVEAFPDEAALNTQGVRALASPPETRRDLRAFVHELPESPPPLLLMADGITDPHNFGAILRTADAAAVNAVIIRERRQVPVTEVVVKASAGAAYSVPIFEVTNLAACLRLLADEGFWSVAATGQPNTPSYLNYRWNARTVLIVGSEGEGVSDLLLRSVDDRVSIPMVGSVESLNVSVAAGILLYEALRQRFRK